MNKLSRVERQKNYWRRHEEIKRQLNKQSTKQFKDDKKLQEEYNQQQKETTTVIWEAEGEQLQKELNELFKKDASE